MLLESSIGTGLQALWRRAAVLAMAGVFTGLAMLAGHLAAAGRAAGRAGSDWAITERVLQTLFSGPLLRRERVGVAVLAGQVTLSGTVATAGERSAVEQAARGVDGVAGVVNLEANNEWQTQHRYMQTEPMAELMTAPADA